MSSLTHMNNRSRLHCAQITEEHKSHMLPHIPTKPVLITFLYSFFFFNDTATTEIYTLSLHDALPISLLAPGCVCETPTPANRSQILPDRKSTRLNSSHLGISYAVFCLKKKKQNT